MKNKSWDDNLARVVIAFLALWKKPLPWVVGLVVFLAVASGNGWIDVPIFTAALNAARDAIAGALIP